jgi:hypothetical protein
MMNMRGRDHDCGRLPGERLFEALKGSDGAGLSRDCRSARVIEVHHRKLQPERLCGQSMPKTGRTSPKH